MQDPKANKDLIRRFTKAIWNEKKVDAISEFLTRDFVGSTPDGEIRGPDGYRNLFHSYTKAFPDCHIDIKDIVGEGDELAILYEFTGTHKGEFQGIAPTGKKVKVLGMAISHYRDGKCFKDQNVWDSYGMRMQLGAVPEAAHVIT